jgi:CRP-like cAMP-binding protein
MKELLVSKIREYIPLNDSDNQIIDSLFNYQEYNANETILKEGDICNKLWFIEKGMVRFATNTDGEDRTFIFRSEGSFISDIEGFIKRTPATKSIIALEDCNVYVITKDDLQRFFQEVTHGERFGRLLVEHIFLASVNHIVSFYTESPETRYIKLLKQNNDFIQRIPQYHIASFLGIKPQSLCRIKKRLLSVDL